MKITALHKNARVTPRKARVWREILAGKTIAEARAQLAWQQGKAVRLLLKVLNSAVANAKNNHQLEEKDLSVWEVQVNEGIKFKRWQPASRGIAHRFQKRTSHLKLILKGGGIEQKNRGKKTAIKTLTAERFSKLRQQKQVVVPEAVKEEQPAGEAPAKTTDAVLKARQKTKMMQQGGDRKKSFRRKSV